MLKFTETSRKEKRDRASTHLYIWQKPKVTRDVRLLLPQLLALAWVLLVFLSVGHGGCFHQTHHSGTPLHPPPPVKEGLASARSCPTLHSAG